MYLLPGLSYKFGESVFDIHMDVFKIYSPGEFALCDLISYLFEAFNYAAGLLLRYDPRLRQHLCLNH